MAAMGAPVFNHRGEVEAAVSISGLREVLLSSDEAAVELLAAADRISALLGWVGGAQ